MNRPRTNVYLDTDIYWSQACSLNMVLEQLAKSDRTQ